MTFYNTFENVLKREIRFLLFYKRKLLYFSTIFPIFLLFIIIGIFEKPVLRDIPIGILDYDNTNLSKELIQMLNASPNIDVAYKVTDILTGKRLMESTDIYGFIVIPEDFTKTVLGYKGENLPVYYNQEFLLIGGVTYSGIVNTIQEFSNKYNLEYEESRGVPEYDAISAVSPIKFHNVILFNPYLNYQYFLLLGLFPAILQLFAIGSTVYSIGFEFKTGKIENITEMLKESPFAAIVGKVFPYFFIYLVILFILLYLQFGYLGTPLERGFLIIVLASILFLITSIASGILIIGLSLGNLRLALSVTAVYAAPALAYAGVTFPSLGMNPLARVWSEFLPLTHYHRILVDNAIRGATTSETPYDLIYLLIFIIASSILGTILVKIWSSKPKFWGAL